MGKYLTDEEVNKLLIRIKSGDNEAWECLYHNFENYIHECAWKYLRKYNIPGAKKAEMESDLYQAGWQGFISAAKNYDHQKGKFLAYAKYDIKGAMAKEIGFLFNPLGLTEKSDNIRNALEDKDSVSVNEAPDRGKYPAERRVLQMMEILRLTTDENHSLSKEELVRLLRLYRIGKYDNGTPPESPNTITATIENMLMELDPAEYSEEKTKEYRITYAGYQENRLKNKLDKKGGKKSPDITDFSYVHTFDYAELDSLIQLICFSDMLAADEKERLVQKLISTSSMYYKTPFWNGEEIRFNPKAVHGRFSRRNPEDRAGFAGNLKIIQKAVNNLVQIRFRFNHFTAGHALAPKSDYLHTLSPYHIVIYHDNAYCIGLKGGDKRIWHYRIDLMSDVEILTDASGREMPIEISAFEGTPICNAYWNPEKYMAEHLNMAYDEPEDIRIKIRNTDYTILYDWFGNHYEKTGEACEDGYDIVKVRTSPSMIVHWAMQYGTAVEVMDDRIREEIRGEVSRMEEMYGNR